MTNKICIRCITEPKKGFGNLSRCITLANTLKLFHIQSHFIINNNNKAISKLENDFQFTIIKKTTDYEQDDFYIKKILEHENSNTLLIDMREYGERISKNFFKHEFKTILIDDAWNNKAYADIIFNGTVIKKYHKYQKVNKNSNIFLGSKYWIANKNFYLSQKYKSKIKKSKKYNVLISMGGADPDNITQKVIDSINKIDNISISVIIGPFFRKFFNSFKKSSYDNIRFINSPKKIWKEFEKTDVAITASGSTLFELAIQGIPTICLVAFKHQSSYANYFEKKGFCKNLGWWQNVSYDNISNILIDLLENSNYRKEMCQNGKKIIDGKGAYRVAKTISILFNNKNS